MTRAPPRSRGQPYLVPTQDQYNDRLSQEELTWRQGLRELLDAKIEDLRDDLLRLTAIGDALSTSVEQRAQIANAALKDLVDASLTSVVMVAASRNEAVRTDIVRLEAELVMAAAAVHDADAAVEQRSVTRYANVTQALGVLETNIIERITALKALIDLRWQMSDLAIQKAEQAADARFKAVNEFRQALADQTSHYITAEVVDAKLSQQDQTVSALDGRFDAWTKAAYTWRSDALSRITALETKFWVGGTGIIVIMTVLQLVLNYLPHR